MVVEQSPSQDFIEKETPKLIDASDEATQDLQAYQALIDFMKQEKPYTNPQLQLSDLAKVVHYRSEYIHKLKKRIRVKKGWSSARE